MRGGSQAQLLRASDNCLYVVKFTNNPQGVRILANDWIASRLARCIGLPVPDVATVEVPQWLIRSTPELVFELQNGKTSCKEGTHFGSQFALDPKEGPLTDLLPGLCSGHVKNHAAFLGALVFDKWTCNTDRRQAVYARLAGSTLYSTFFIDQGHCFNATNWDFPDSPLYGLCGTRDVYLQVTGWECFEPWLTRAESLDAQAIWEIATSTAPAWYENDSLALEQLVSQIVLRQRRLRGIVSDLQNSTVNLFPNWRRCARSILAKPSPYGGVRKGGVAIARIHDSLYCSMVAARFLKEPGTREASRKAAEGSVTETRSEDDFKKAIVIGGGMVNPHGVIWSEMNYLMWDHPRSRSTLMLRIDDLTGDSINEVAEAIRLKNEQHSNATTNGIKMGADVGKSAHKIPREKIAARKEGREAEDNSLDMELRKPNTRAGGSGFDRLLSKPSGKAQQVSGVNRRIP